MIEHFTSRILLNILATRHAIFASYSHGPCSRIGQTLTHCSDSRFHSQGQALPAPRGRLYLGSADTWPVCTRRLREVECFSTLSNVKTLEAAQRIIRGWRAHAQVAYSTESCPLTYESTTYARVAWPAIFRPTTPTSNFPVHSLARVCTAPATMVTRTLTSVPTDRAPDLICLRYGHFFCTSYVLLTLKFSALERLTMTHLDHDACRCIKQWLVFRSRWPSCRQEVYDHDLRRIYL